MLPLPFCDAVAARLRRVVVVDGASRAVVVLLAGGAAAIAIDWQWHLPSLVRLGLASSIGAAAASVALARILRPLRKPWTAPEIARLAERAAPALGGRLATAVAGIDLGATEQARLDALLTPDLARRLVPAPRLPRHIGLAATALVAVGAAPLVAPRWTSDGVTRLLLPLGATEWTRFTTLEAHLERTVAPVDEGLVLRIRRQHPQSSFAEPVVVTTSNASQEDRRLLPGLTGTTWTHPISGTPGTYRLVVTSGDALPVEVVGRLVRRPDLDRLRVTVTPPTYTGLPPSTGNALGAGIIAGSTVAVEVHLRHEDDRPLTTATLAFAGADLPVKNGEDGWFQVSFAPAQSGDLTVLAKDADGIGPAAPVRLPVAVVPDRAPTATLEGPTPREAVTVAAVVDLRLEAGDDLGLATVAVLAAGDKPAAPVFEDRADGLAASRTLSVAVGAHAAEGGTLTLTARATDRNDRSGPGVGLSEPLVLRVASEEQVRQDLDRLLGEARDRLIQGREHLAKAAAGHPADSAVQAGERARDLLSQVLRRWRENHFDAQAITPAAGARTTLVDEALPRLAADDRSAVDTALAKAERLLSSLLGEGDLTRLITSLVTREQALAEESRAFVRASLLKPLDAAGKQAQAALAARQKDLATQVVEAQRRVLAQEGGAWKDAQDLVRREDPGERLRQAATDLASNDRRPAAVAGQQEAIASLAKLLDQLKGGDAAKDLAGRIGAVAAAQERLAAALDRGQAAKTLADRQEDLARETERLAKEAERPGAAAAKRLTAALASQRSAGKAMSGNQADAASRDANAAAALLREAQEQLAPSPTAKDDQKKDQDKPDVVAALRQLAAAQAALVTDATLLDQAIGEQDLDFARQRQVQALATAQKDLRLRLDDEVVKRLAEHPIARLGVERIAGAIDDSAAHLGRPALGQAGVRLTRAALAEIERLIAVATPPPAAGKNGQGGGGGGGGKSDRSPQAEFPPRGELALLATLQNDLATRTAAGSPGDLAGDQGRLKDLAQALGSGLRPETRPWVLVERARRAMASAAWHLGQGDRGLTTRHEQEAAEAALRRLLAEAEPPQGGGSGGGQGGNKPPPTAGKSGGGNDQSGGGSGAQAQGGGKGGSSATGSQVLAEDGGTWMNLPPERREQLREARKQALTPRQLQVYGRYLELLEEK